MNSDSNAVVVTELRYPAWESLRLAQGLGKSFPLLVHYDGSGRCIRQETPDQHFSLAGLQQIQPQQPQCTLAWQTAELPDSPTGAAFTARLYVLDVPFCTGCVQAEQVLRAWVQAQPEQRRLHLVKVIPPSKAEMPTAASVQTAVETAD